MIVTNNYGTSADASTDENCAGDRTQPLMVLDTQGSKGTASVTHVCQAVGTSSTLHMHNFVNSSERREPVMP